jgi:ferredoxin-NADP reductase
MTTGPAPFASRSASTAPGIVGLAAAEPNATLVRRIDLTPAVARFIVRPDQGVPAFAPGQYFALGLALDGRVLQRPYSAASRPGSGRYLEFLIRRVPGGRLTPVLWELGEGTRLRLGRPKGLFGLDRGERQSHLFVATGTGLAPALSMLGSLRASVDSAMSTPWRAVVVHGTSSIRELAYRDRLERWARADPRLAYVPVVSRPGHPANAGWNGATGRVDGLVGAICERHGLDAAGTVAYVCGNPEAIDSVTRALMARGFPPGAIVTEQYWAPSGSPPARSA